MQGDIPDENVIDKVLETAIAVELKYRNQLEKRKKDALDKAKQAAEKLLKLRDEEDHEGENKEIDD